MINSIPYMNISDEDVPQFAFVELLGTADVAATGVISAKVDKPADVTKQYALDLGKGAGTTGPTKYGQCYDPGIAPTWAYYTAATPPPDGSQVGPVSGSWEVSVMGTGYFYCGVHEATNERILIKKGVTDGGIIFGRATSSIGICTNPLTGATAFTFREFLTLDATVTPHTEVEDAEDTPGVNRLPIGAGIDTIVIMAKVKGEWHLINFVEQCPT